MEFQTIIFENTDRIATITLNRPEVLNALNQQMLDELTQAISQVSQNEEIRVLIIKGANHAFCAGADLDIMSAGSMVFPSLRTLRCMCANAAAPEYPTSPNTSPRLT